VERRIDLGLDSQKDRMLESLAWRDHGVRLAATAAAQCGDGQLLEPRNAKRLCHALFTRAILIEGFGLHLDDFASTRRRVDMQIRADVAREVERAATKLTKLADMRTARVAQCIDHRKYNLLDVLAKRRVFEEQTCLINSVPSWETMMQEESISAAIRPYLVASSQTIQRIEHAFRTYDKDGDGRISVAEFQQIVFEVGQTLTTQEAAQALHEIDKNGNGVIEPIEFALWWLLSEKELKDREISLTMRKLKASLALKRNIVRVKQAVKSRAVPRTSKGPKSS